MEYLILESESIAKLQEALNSHSKDGWRVLPGGVAVAVAGSHPYARFATMIERRAPWYSDTSEAE